jgi:ABC-type phosphate/phosphonate transport system substrate-binding protein
MNSAGPDGRSSLIASLGMYDAPPLRDANNALWTAIAGRLTDAGIAAPNEPTRDRDLPSLWRAPNLLLAQTCGYPLVTTLKGAVRVVATPRYTAEGCEGAFHRSAYVVAQANTAASLADLRGRRCAVNELTSNTGMNLLRVEISSLAEGRRFFGEVTQTGSHAASLAAVADGRADIASLDAVTFAHLRRYEPHLSQEVRVLGWSQPSPGLPLITSLKTSEKDLAALRQALSEVSADPVLCGVRDALLLDGFELLPEATYGLVLDLQRIAEAHGYPELT